MDDQVLGVPYNWREAIHILRECLVRHGIHLRMDKSQAHVPAARHDGDLACALAAECLGVAVFNPHRLVLGTQMDGACATCLAAAGPTPGPVTRRLEKA